MAGGKGVVIDSVAVAHDAELGESGGERATRKWSRTKFMLIGYGRGIWAKVREVFRELV